MKERLSVLLGVLAAAYLIWGIFAPTLPPAGTQKPLSIDSGPNGHLGLQRWLSQSGVLTHSLREPLTTLTTPESHFARPGHVLVTVMPHEVSPSRDEMNALLDWVSEGNTLVVLAGLNDTPSWTPSANTAAFVDHLAYLTSLNATFRTVEKSEEAEATGAPDRLPEPLDFALAAIQGHWLTADVRELAASSDLPTGPWDIESDPGAPAYVIARVPDGRIDALLVTDLGEGAIIVSTFASLLQNSVIARRDNRQLVVNLLAHHLGPEGTVIFDDFHHGLTSAYDARAFFADPRLAWTAALLLCFWLVYAVFADSRLGRPVEPDDGPSQTGFVRALGGFLSRTVSRQDASLRLVENFLAHVRPYLDQGPEQSIWQRVGDAPRMDAALAESLRRDHALLLEGRAVDLQNLQRRLTAARRAFS